VFEIAAPSDSYVLIREIRIGQYSDFGDAAAEILSVQVIRGHTTTGSGGSAVTPVNWSPVSGALTATSTVAANNTRLRPPARRHADFRHDERGGRLVVGSPARSRRQGAGPSDQAAQRLVVRITAPADSLTMNGTLVFEEVGQFPA
jgi:hypothetical protein